MVRYNPNLYSYMKKKLLLWATFVITLPGLWAGPPSKISPEVALNQGNSNSFQEITKEISKLSRRLQYFDSQAYLARLLKSVETSGYFFSRRGKFFTTSALGLFGPELQLGLSRSVGDQQNTTKILLLGKGNEVVFQLDASGRVRANGFEGDGSSLRNIPIRALKGLNSLAVGLDQVENIKQLPYSFLEDTLSAKDPKKVPSSQAVARYVREQVSNLEAGLNLAYEPRNSNIVEHVYAQKGNPHRVTKSDVGLTDVVNIDVLGSFEQRNGSKIATQKVMARDQKGLNLTDGRGKGIHIHDGGNIGVGTEHPTHKLELFGTGESISSAALGVIQGSGRGHSVMRLRNQAPGGRTFTIGLGGAEASSHPQALYISDDSASVSRMVLDKYGRVGIGTRDPQVLLDVGGTLNAHSVEVSGTLTAGTLSVVGGIRAANLGTIASQDAQEVHISGGSIRGIEDISISDGGTGASVAIDARKNLGLEIGKNVQKHHPLLEKLATKRAKTMSMLFDTGSSLATRTATEVRSYLGLESLAHQSASAVNIRGGKIQGTSLDGVLIGESFPAFATFTHVEVRNGILGQVQSPQQPMIQSVGTLKSLSVAGDVRLGGDRILIDTRKSKITLGSNRRKAEVEISGGVRADSLELKKKLVAQSVLIYGDLKARNIGSIASQDSRKVLIEGGKISGIQDILVTDGGTGASTPKDARKNLGLEIGKQVQPFHPTLSSLAALPPLQNQILVRDGSKVKPITSAKARKILKLKSMAFQDSSSVGIGGGILTGVKIDAARIGLKIPGPAKFTRIDSLGGLYGSLRTPYQKEITRVGTLDYLAIKGGFRVGPANLVVNSRSKRVGIGTTTPLGLLHVAGTLRVRQICDESGKKCIDVGKDLPVPGKHASGAFVGAKGATSGKDRNQATGERSAVVAGVGNLVSGLDGFLGAGYRNQVPGDGAGVVGGNANTASGIRSFIGGGNVNTASGELSAIAGGNLNTASGLKSYVGGGNVNVASGVNSTVGGGQSNKALGLNSTIAGGSLNLSRSKNSIVGGGSGNSASGEGSAVLGGFQNEARGDFSTIPGGQNLIIEGDGNFGFNGTKQKISIPRKVKSSALFLVKSFGIGIGEPTALLHVDDRPGNDRGYIRASNFNPIPAKFWPQFDQAPPYLLKNALWIGWDSRRKVWKYYREYEADRGISDPGNPTNWKINGSTVGYYDGNQDQLPPGTHLNNRYNPRMPAARCGQDDIQVRAGSTWVDKYPSAIIDVGFNYAGGEFKDDSPVMRSSGNNKVPPTWMAFSQRRRGSTGMTWFVAAQAAANAGKRLLSNSQWQTAAMGTIRSSGNQMVDGNDWKVISSQDFSRFGVVGMAGNLWEWVGEWGQFGRDMTISRGEGLDAWGSKYGSDFTYNINGKAFTNDRMSWVTGLPGAMHRGGYWAQGENAGIFALAADAAPSRWETTIGFRTGR